MNFWWVSQNQTWNQEISGGYMWSPQLTSDGKNIFHYENMLLVKKGDIVLSYYDQKIQALGIITSEAYDFPKPLEFRSAGDDWNTDGWKVDVTYKDLNPPLSPKDFWDELQPVLPSRYSPLNYNGGGYQGYLFKIPNNMASLVLGKLIINQF